MPSSPIINLIFFLISLNKSSSLSLLSPFKSNILYPKKHAIFNPAYKCNQTVSSFSVFAVLCFRAFFAARCCCVLGACLVRVCSYFVTSSMNKYSKVFILALEVVSVFLNDPGVFLWHIFFINSVANVLDIALFFWCLGLDFALFTSIILSACFREEKYLPTTYLLNLFILSFRDKNLPNRSSSFAISPNTSLTLIGAMAHAPPLHSEAVRVHSFSVISTIPSITFWSKNGLLDGSFNIINSALPPFLPPLNSLVSLASSFCLIVSNPLFLTSFSLTGDSKDNVVSATAIDCALPVEFSLPVPKAFETTVSAAFIILDSKLAPLGEFSVVPLTASKAFETTLSAAFIILRRSVLSSTFVISPVTLFDVWSELDFTFASLIIVFIHLNQGLSENLAETVVSLNNSL